MAIPISEKRQRGCESWMLAMYGEFGMIPESTIETIAWWVYYGLPPGSFVEAVLKNDLYLSFRRADAQNLAVLGDIVRMIYRHAPDECWGSVENYLTWSHKVRQMIEKENKDGPKVD